MIAVSSKTFKDVFLYYKSLHSKCKYIIEASSGQVCFRSPSYHRIYFNAYLDTENCGLMHVSGLEVEGIEWDFIFDYILTLAGYLGKSGILYSASTEQYHLRKILLKYKFESLKIGFKNHNSQNNVYFYLRKLTKREYISAQRGYYDYEDY